MTVRLTLRYRLVGGQRRLTDPDLLREVEMALPDGAPEPWRLVWREAMLATASLRPLFSVRRGAYQCRDREPWSDFDQDVIDRFATLYGAGASVDPIVILDFGDAGFSIPDGAHRAAAALAFGGPEVAALVCRLEA